MDGFVVFSLAMIMADSTWQETNGSTGKRNSSLFSLLSLIPSWYPRYETALSQLGGGGVGDSLFPIHSCMQPDHLSMLSNLGYMVASSCGSVVVSFCTHNWLGSEGLRGESIS